MSPAIEAALIAGGVGVLTLIGTLLAQFYGIRRTSGDTEKTLRQQREHLDATLEEQREQLAATLAQERDRTLNERFATAADRLGSDRPAVQLAGVHAMAGLADDWPENRQTCVDVLCAYLRLPYDPEPSEDAASADLAAYRGNREVRHTIIRLIGAHLRKHDAAESWEGLNLDLTGVVFDGGDFSGAVFSGEVSFGGAVFSGGRVSFNDARFSGGEVRFSGTIFRGGEVDFRNAYKWSRAPIFDWADTGPPPAGVLLPESTDATP